MPTMYARTLRRAAELSGGHEALARELRVPTNQLASWLAGRASPPGDVFLRAVDIIGEHNLHAIRQSPAAPGADVPL
jgi:DNA-binding transcriptional regulator YiaG